MVQENPTKDQTTILILGRVNSEKQDFFGILNSFSLLAVSKNERTVLNIPAWPLLVALVALFLARARRSRRS